VIILDHVTKRFKSGRGVRTVLSDVSFTVGKGKIVAVIGTSGAGKTTLLNCIGGLEKPDMGSVTCFRENIHRLSARKLSGYVRKNIGFVFQGGNLISYLTVSENISFPLTLNRITGKRNRTRVEELLDLIGLSDTCRAMPHELSGGERQRVSIARAIAHNPLILLADEPTASLDSSTGAGIIKLMATLNKQQGCTTLFSTHDREIIKIADGVLTLKDGEVLK
jgi:putative ABC transport system ATP-binding protein